MIKCMCFLMFLFFHSAWSVHDEELYLVAEPEFNLLETQSPELRLLAEPEFNLLETQSPEFRFAQPPEYIYTYKHWCHLRTSTTSQLIDSSNPNRVQACADHGMESGQSYPMKYACSDEDGNILKTIDSPLSKEEACEKGIFSTAAINTLARFLCEHTENSEECEQNLLTEDILPEPTMLLNFQLEKRALIERIGEQIP